MKKLRTLTVALSLVCALSVNAFAGDAECPVAEPSPTPQTQAVNATDDQQTILTATTDQNAAPVSDYMLFVSGLTRSCVQTIETVS
jgi:hypothetical protein